jgi:hypothetical protein
MKNVSFLGKEFSDIINHCKAAIFDLSRHVPAFHYRSRFPDVTFVLGESPVD